MPKTKLVNWQGQMKIDPAHFVQTENFFINEINDTRAVFQSKNEYGLLPLTEDSPEVGIQIREHISNHVEITLHSCNAVTASGERIAFNPKANESPLSKTYSAEQDSNARSKGTTHWDIILSVDPYVRIACGELDPHEAPPRHPDSEKEYKLHIIPSDELNMSAFGSHFLTIGKMRKNGERYVVDTNYIPPCRTMSAHSELVDYFRRFDKHLYDIRKSSLEIIAKVNNKPAGSELAANIRTVGKEVLQYLTSVHFLLKNNGTALSPVVMSQLICNLASHCYVSLVCLPSVQKDELLQYFYEWSDITPGAFEEIVSDTMELQYEHENLRAVMVRLETFVDMLSGLWERLSNLEYIGQHKESLIVSVREASGCTEPKRSYFVE